MARRWTDPRDGCRWLIDAMPFDFGPSGDPGRAAPHGWTLLFASGKDHRRLPVGYEVGTDLGALQDPQLMALLDAATVRR